MTNPYRVAYVSDVHVPFHDSRAVDLALKILSHIKPDMVFFGGDIVDCYSVSDFDRDPARVVRFQEEFDATFVVMREFRRLAKEAEFLPGNHEDRWERTKNRHPFLASLRDVRLEKLLRLEELKVKPLTHGEDRRIGRLFYMHGDECGGSGGVFPARTVYLKEQGNIVFGHFHRMQVFYNRLKDGTCHGSWANGCLCDLKQPYTKGTTQWQQGITIVEHHDSGLFHVHQILFFSTGRDRKLYGEWQDRLYWVN
ncbi:MAG: metallophosphoesterase [Patescibacteria group bacterium]|nr:metallophosphoesterase [Patescibacteria group bacterium]